VNNGVRLLRGEAINASDSNLVETDLTDQNEPFFNTMILVNEPFIELLS
jgi:hypothetical protein